MDRLWLMGDLVVSAKRAIATKQWFGKIKIYSVTRECATSAQKWLLQRDKVDISVSSLSVAAAILQAEVTQGCHFPWELSLLIIRSSNPWRCTSRHLRAAKHQDTQNKKIHRSPYRKQKNPQNSQMRPKLSNLAKLWLNFQKFQHVVKIPKCGIFLKFM